MSPLKVFVSYAHENVEYKNDLKRHCSLFEEENEIELWIDDDIRAGDKFDDCITEEILKADIAILLLSSTYWSKEYIKDTELPLILEQEESRGMTIIPILINGGNKIKRTKLKGRSLVPVEQNTLKAIEDFQDKERAWAIIYDEIDKQIEIFEKNKESQKNNKQDDQIEKVVNIRPKICIYTANPLNNVNNFDYKNIISRFQKYSVDLYHKVLNEDTLLDNYEYDFNFIFTKCNRNKIIIEDEYFIQKSVPVKDFEDSIDLDKSIIFLNEEIKDTKLNIVVIDDNKIKNFIASYLHKEFKGLRGEYKVSSWDTDLPDAIDTKNLINFVGRNSDIENIVKKILTVRDENKILTIKGSGGIGKTTIISKAVTELAERGKFKDGIKFVECEYVKDYEDFENKITFAFDMDNAIEFKTQLKELYVDEERLIILDNVETLLHLNDTEDIKNLIKLISDYASIALTSREVLSEEYEDIYELRSLTTDEAEELFIKLYKIKKYDKKLLRTQLLEEYLNNNPLAIKLVTKNLPSGKDLNHLIGELHKSFFDITAIDIEKIFEKESDLNIERTKSLFQSINYSYQKLSEKEKLALEILSLFPDGIPLDIFIDFYNKGMKNHKIDKKEIKQKLDNFSDRDIKSLENKSLIINNNQYISLQSIIGRFADYKFSQKENDEKNEYYEKAFLFNLFIFNLLKRREVRSNIEARIFDQNKNNFLKSLDYIGYIKKDNHIYEYLDDLVGNFAFNSSPNKKIILKLEKLKKEFKNSEFENIFLDSLILTISYVYGDFLSSFKKIEEIFPLEILVAHLVEENKIINKAYGNISTIYEMEGYPFKLCQHLLNNKIMPGPYMLLVLGEYNMAIKNNEDRDKNYYNFSTFDLLYNMHLLDIDKLDLYVKSLYKTQHIEKTQSLYTLLKAKEGKVTLRTIKKLIITNPFTDGLKTLMLAMKSKQNDSREQYEKAIKKLYHIRYYYVEAIFLYCKYLKKDYEEDYISWLEKGKSLAEKHHYRYLLHQFICLESDKDDVYDEVNYPLPEKLDYSLVVGK